MDDQSRFLSFMANKKVLIAKTSQGSRVGLASTLKDMGVRPTEIVLATHFESALELIEKLRPHILICDYQMGDKNGIELISRRNELITDLSSGLSVVVTRDAQESSIAEAIEENVDCYILKPFTIHTFRDRFVKAVLEKVRPSPLHSALNSGRTLLNEGKVDEAINTIQMLITDRTESALPHYHLALAFIKKGNLSEAKKTLETGLKKFPEHYRCLNLAFDVYFQLSESNAAYETGLKIIERYPLTPQRLDAFLRLCVAARNFEPIDLLYETYLGIENRPPSLVKVMVAALVVAGVKYSESDQREKALDLLKKAVVSSGRSPKTFKEAIQLLAERKAYDLAEAFLREYPSELKTEPDYLILDYVIADGVLKASQLVEKGRKLLNMGIQDPKVYEILIRRTHEIKHKDTAESLAHDAIQKWPDQIEKFKPFIN